MKKWLLSFAGLLCVLAAPALRAQQDAQAPLAAHVLNRIAYGPRPGDLQRVQQTGVDAYIDQQLHPESIALPDSLKQKLTKLNYASQSAGEVLRTYRETLAETKDESDTSRQKRREQIGKIIEETSEARVWRALESPRQLEEVMVEFWFNHFNVFRDKGIDRALIASYERDAIRPYVFGHFRDMLAATAKHPAMLFYLDNWLSTSAAYQPPRARRETQNPKQKSTGLNENYARELMELHTLGVDGGYTQKDVTELARMLTGWSFGQKRGSFGFEFDAERHDNGSKQWLGKTVRADGQSEGEYALDVLAMHPQTARHLSYQLAQFFVADEPPVSLVDKLSKRYLATSGDLREVMKTLLSSDEFRNPQVFGAKYKTPYQFLLSALRAGDVQVTNIRPVLGMLSQLGMPLYGCQTPDGYKNTQVAWMNPDALTRRISIATGIATGRLPLLREIDEGDKMGRQQLERQATGNERKQVMPELNAAALTETLGPIVSSRTIAVANNNPLPLRAALLLGSPDFMQH